MTDSTLPRRDLKRCAGMTSQCIPRTTCLMTTVAESKHYAFLVEISSNLTGLTVSHVG